MLGLFVEPLMRVAREAKLALTDEDLARFGKDEAFVATGGSWEATSMGIFHVVSRWFKGDLTVI